MRRLAILFALLPALAGADDAAERAAIAAERKALLERFAAQEQACRQRFVVTACVNDVHLRRRDALAPLRERELRLDDAERLRSAEKRRLALEAKRASAAAPAPASSSAPAPATVAPAAPATHPSQLAPAQRPAASGDDARTRAARAAQRARAYDERVKAAEAAQERIARRLAERPEHGKHSQPLPQPGAPAASSAPAASAGGGN